MCSMRYYEVEIEIKTYPDPNTAKYNMGVWARSKSGALIIGMALAKRRYNKVLSVKLAKNDD